MTPIDQSQRQAALDLTTSVIIQAPAGSGKTELLCQRFLTALAQVEQPEQVLAITFTKKAAEEMAERILRYLHTEEHCLAQPVLAQNQKYNWQLLAHPERLSIMTIDSLCARITEQAPITSSLYGYQISDAPAELYRNAVLSMLEDVDKKHPWQTALHDLLLQCHNQWQSVHDLLISMLMKREQWLILLPEINQPDQWRQHLENNLTACLQQAINTLDQALPDTLKNKLLNAIHFARQHTDLLAAWKTLDTWPATSIGAESLWRSLAEFLLTQENQLRKTVDKRSGFPVGEADDKDYFKMQKQNMLEFLNEAAITPKLLTALQMMRQIPSGKYDEMEWQQILTILSVLRALLAYWQLTIEQKKQVDFTEIALHALTSLGTEETPTELALALDYRIQHILVDEFQDTSLLQFTLLERLTQSWQDHDGHSLFLVGDPLQSIYRFRQAEVGLFLRTWQKGFPNLNLRPIQLQQNFRAQKNLVEFYNQYLAQILPNTSILHEGAVAYVPVVAARLQTIHPAVFFIAHPPSLEAAEQDKATLIVQDIQQLLAQYPDKTLAVLVRARNHLKQLLPALKLAAIDYQALDLTYLNDQPVIIDLLSCLKALLNLEDRLSWLSVLHAPFVGLSLRTLQQLFEKDTRLIWQRLLEWNSHPEENLHCSTQEINQLKKVIAIWQLQLEQRQRQPLDQILYELWQTLNAADYWSDDSSKQASDQFFYLLQNQQIAGDLQDLDAFERYLAQIPFVANEQNARLQIMTIHKAKGLEFDIVLLPALERASSHDEAPLLLFDDIILPVGSKLLLAPLNKKSPQKHCIFNFLWQVQRNKSAHERLRLLYVACTRAKEAIYFYACLPNTTDKNKNPKQGSFLADLWQLPIIHAIDH